MWKVSNAVTAIVLDILKPRVLPSIELGKQITCLRGVNKAVIQVREINTETETIKLTVQGSSLDFKQIEATLKRLGVAIHSIDEVVVERRA